MDSSRAHVQQLLDMCNPQWDRVVLVGVYVRVGVRRRGGYCDNLRMMRMSRGQGLLAVPLDTSTWRIYLSPLHLKHFKHFCIMIRLNCPAQTYAWGKFGEQSLVAYLKRNADRTFVVSDSTPYAELWMGTHPNGPATLQNSGEPLLEYLKAHPEAVGVVPPRYRADQLPFIFKVLSVRTALSIQSHPDIELAKKLHSKQPEFYKDANHKPEMSVALTPFEALCGFRPLSQILSHLHHYPELADIIGSTVTHKLVSANLSNVGVDCNSASHRALLKELFASFMQATDDLVNIKITELVQRIGSSPGSECDGDNTINSLIVQLNNDFPNDRGVLCPLLLNHVRLAPGDAFFMGANEPHAYLSGDCLECMALSDNTVRAGLTPKHRDVETLIEMLHYRNEGQECHMLRPEQISSHTVLYRPPSDVCSEFEVERTTVMRDEGTYLSPPLPCGSIIIVVSGRCSVRSGDSGADAGATECADTGSVYFVAAHQTVHITADGEEAVVVFRAHINLGRDA